MIDMVNSPMHYAHGKYECIDVMKDVFGVEATEEFCLLNAFKYLYRCKYKGKFMEDLKKADKYIDMLIEMRGERTEIGRADGILGDAE